MLPWIDTTVLSMTTTVAVFDTKKYDKDHLGAVLERTEGLDVKFREYRLSPETVETVVDGTDVVCVFVNDKVTAEVIAVLADKGVKLIALRCAGFNGVDLQAAQDHGITVARVPAYSPYAVAEHAVTLAMALNRKIPQANRRVRDMNFTLDGLVGFDMHGKTVGLIGTGKIGKIAAQIFKGFGTRSSCGTPTRHRSGLPSRAWSTRRSPRSARPPTSSRSTSRCSRRPSTSSTSWSSASSSAASSSSTSAAAPSSTPGR